jgi:hypothetical protein
VVIVRPVEASIGGESGNLEDDKDVPEAKLAQLVLRTSLKLLIPTKPFFWRAETSEAEDQRLPIPLSQLPKV